MDVDSGFGFVDERLRAGVERLLEAGHDPGDPMAGYYVSPERAREYAGALDSSVLDERLEQAAQRLGLDRLGSAVLALCVAPELDTAYMRVFGFLHDDVTRKLPSPRVIADLLETDFERFHVLLRPQRLEPEAAIDETPFPPPLPAEPRFVRSRIEEIGR